MEARSNNHHQSKDNEVEPKMSQITKITKIFYPDFLTYLLENEFQTYLVKRTWFYTPK